MAKSAIDPAMFYYKKKDRLRGMISLNVDDAVIAGDRCFHEDIMEPMFVRFKFGKRQAGDFNCLGWNIEQKQGQIWVSQSDYAQTLKRLNIKQEGLMQKSTVLTEANKSLVRRLVGKLRWVGDQSRPDICYELLWLSITAAKPTVYEYDLANQLVNRVKGREVKLMYKKFKESAKWYVSVFTDAALAGLPDKVSSPYGIVIFLSNGYEPRQRNYCAIVHWRSAKVKRVISGPYDGEVLALAEGLEEGIVIRKQLLLMTGLKEDMIQVEGLCDNKGTVEAIDSYVMKKAKGIRIGLEVAKIREMKESGEVASISWLETNFQLADALTKFRAAREPLLQVVETGKFMY